MPSHMSTVGFSVGPQHDLIELAKQAIDAGELRDLPDGSAYYVWSPGAGVELWAQVSPQRECIGLNPHFNGPARMQVGITQRVHRRNDSALDGAFYCWAGTDEDKPGSTGFPFVFDAPDYRLHDELALPSLSSVQIAVFAHSLDAFSDEEAFRASGSKFAPESWFPTGTFTREGDALKTLDPPMSEVLFHGRVVDTAQLTNPHSSQQFYWAQVSVFGEVFDVVADPTIVQGTITKNGVIGGFAWMSGRIV